MLENPLVEIVALLAGWFAPFILLVSMNTEYVTKMAAWEGKKAQLTSSVIGILLGGLTVLAYLVPAAVLPVGVALFLDICWVGPSGGHDLLLKFAERVGSAKK